MANSTKISEYSTTAANNTSIDSIDIDENCAASGINNAIRSVLKHQADAFTQGTPIALDQTNNRVGIGTTSPDEVLHIAKGANSSIRLGQQGGDYAYRLRANVSGSVNGGFLIEDAVSKNDLYNVRSGSSGFHKFSIDGTEAMQIDSSGNVGIGTDAPTTYGDSNTKLAVVTPTSNANDVNIRFGTNDVKGIIFVNDVSGNSIGFGTTTDAPVLFNTNNTERMRLDGGEALIGTTSAGSSTRLHLKGGETLCVMQNDDANGGTYQTTVRFRNSSGNSVGAIKLNSTSVAYNSASDYRLKENVTDMTGAIARVKQLAPKRFQFIADADTTVDGFLAHEAQAVVPEAITGTKDEVDEDGNAVMQGIDQSKLVPLLTGALKEAIAKIETLETEITALKERVTALEA